MEMAMFAFFALFRLMGMIEPTRIVARGNAVPLWIVLILHKWGVRRNNAWDKRYALFDDLPG